MTSAASHQTAATMIVLVSASRPAVIAVIAPEHRRLAAGEEHGDPQQLRERHGLVRQRLERRQPAGGPVDGPVRFLGELRRRLRRGDADAEGRLELAVVAELAQAAEGVEVGAVVAAVERDRDPVGREQRRDRGVLAAAPGRTQLEDLASPARLETGPPGLGGELVRPRLGGALVLDRAPVQRLDRALVLDP